MHAALGDRADAALLAAPAAQEGVEAEAEAAEPREDEERAQSDGWGQGLYAPSVPPMRTILERRVRKRGSARSGANSRALVKCSASLSPAFTAFSM